MNHMAEMDENHIKQAVRRRYAELAVLNEPCCSPLTTALGERDEVPKESVASAASCGSPLTHAGVREGDVVLDVGSGGGIDVFRASRLVGSAGKVIGVDSTPEMVFKAKELAKKYDYKNVEFRLGEIEHLPVESNSVDLVISNCVLNLVPDKELAIKEIYRVLKPGGRIAISDMITTSSSTKEHAINPEDWAACIAGAITIDEYKELLQKTGFQDVKYLDENLSMSESCCSTGIPVKSITWLAAKSPLGKLMSRILRVKSVAWLGRKPLT